jgi:uncharacterized protein (TIGR00369 family)
VTALNDAIREARASGDFNIVARAVPYFRFLRLDVRREERGLVVLMPQDEKFIGNAMIPALHGGSLGAMMEAAAILQLLAASDSEHVPKTIDITVDYLRPPKPVDTFAFCSLTKHGRRVANVHVSCWQADPEKPVAAMHGHFLLA